MEEVRPHIFRISLLKLIWASLWIFKNLFFHLQALFWFPTQSCCLLLGYLCSSSSCPLGSLLQRAPSQCGKSAHSSWVNFRIPVDIKMILVFDKNQLHVPLMCFNPLFLLVFRNWLGHVSYQCYGQHLL